MTSTTRSIVLTIVLTLIAVIIAMLKPDMAAEDQAILAGLFCTALTGSLLLLDDPVPSKGGR